MVLLKLWNEFFVGLTLQQSFTKKSVSLSMCSREGTILETCSDLLKVWNEL